MKNRRTQGFTLIELLIVIAIIGILAAVLIPNLLAARTRGVLTAGTSYAREALVALESMQSSNSQVDYARSSANATLVTGGSVVSAASVNLWTSATTTAAFNPSDYLKAPTQGVTKVIFYPNTGNGFIEVDQTISTNAWCTQLNIQGQQITQTKAACDATY